MYFCDLKYFTKFSLVLSAVNQVLSVIISHFVNFLKINSLQFSKLMNMYPIIFFIRNRVITFRSYCPQYLEEQILYNFRNEFTVPYINYLRDSFSSGGLYVQYVDVFSFSFTGPVASGCFSKFES